MAGQTDHKGHCWGWYAGSYCLGGINVIFALCALLLASVALLLERRSEIPAPEFLWGKVKNLLRENGLGVQCRSVSVDGTGNVHLRDLQLSYGLDDQLLVQSESALIHLDLLGLLFGLRAFNGVKINNAVLYCPAIYSASGVNEPMLDKVYLSLHRKGREWVLDEFICQKGNLSATVRQLSVSDATVTGPSARPAGNPMQMLATYFAVCRKVQSYQKPLEGLSEPIFAISLANQSDRAASLDLELLAAGTVYPPNYKAGPFRLTVKGVDLASLKTTQPVYVEITKLANSDWAVCDFQAILPWDSFKFDKFVLPREVRFRAASVSAYNDTVENVTGVIYPQNYPWLSGTANFQWKGNNLAVQGRMEAVRRAGQLTVATNSDLKCLLAMPPWEEYKLDTLFDWSALPKFQVTASFGDGFQFQQANFEIEVRNFSYRQAAFARVWAQGRFDREKIRLDDAAVENHGYRVAGAYEQNWADSGYRFLLAGTIIPTDLNPILESWWGRLWKDFQFDGKFPPYGDVDLRGNWMRGEEVLFLSARGGPVIYKSLPVNYCSLKVRLKPGLTEAYDLNIWRGKSHTTGRMQWLTDNANSEVPYTRSMEFQSDLPLDDLKLLVDDKTKELLNNFQLTSAPRVELAGAYQENRQNVTVAKNYHISARLDSPLTFRNIPLSNLSFQAVLRNDSLQLDEVTGGFCGGALNGSLSLNGLSSAGVMDYKLTLAGADYQSICDFFGHNNDASNKPGKPPISSGKIDANLAGSGDTQSIKSQKAEGYVKIYETNLGKIRLFGLLSELLKIGAMNIDTAEGVFSLNRGVVNFARERKLALTGKGVSLQAFGDITVPERDMDLTVRLDVFDNALLKVLFEPLGRSLEFHLKGTPDNPQWGASFVHSAAPSAEKTPEPKPAEEKPAQNDNGPTPLKNEK